MGVRIDAPRPYFSFLLPLLSLLFPLFCVFPKKEKKKESTHYKSTVVGNYSLHLYLQHSIGKPNLIRKKSPFI